MLIDLTVTLNQHTPVYPGDAPVQIKSAAVIEQDGWNDYVISINTHVGTHIDAPLHMIASGKTLDQVSIEQFVGRGRLVEVDKAFSIEDLEKAAIQAGDIVLFHSGMSDHYHEPTYFETYPVMNEEIAHYLVDKKVSMVGVDMGSGDRRVRIHTFRIKPGNDLKLGLIKFVEANNIHAGLIVTCVGGLSHAVLRMAGALPDKQDIRHYDGDFEITSLVGTVSINGVHLHMSISDRNGRTFGGHLKDGTIIHPTAEVVVGEDEQTVYGRELDKTTGFPELIVNVKNVKINI